MKNITEFFINESKNEISIDSNANFVALEIHEDVMHWFTNADIKSLKDEGNEAVDVVLDLKVGESYFDSEVIYVRIK